MNTAPIRSTCDSRLGGLKNLRMEESLGKEVQGWAMPSRTVVLKQEQQNPLEGLLKLTLPGSTPEFDTVGLGWCLNACACDKSQVMLKLLVWGPHFENHCSKTTSSYQMPTETGKVMSVSDP